MAAEPGDAPLVLRQLDQGVLLLTLNRPERNNAWTLGLENAYFDALTDGAADPDVRVVVVTGAGRSFCPGIDMQVLSASVEGKHLTNDDRRPMTFARTVPKPVIAAINGACAGIGFIQACSADIRFAVRGAKLTTAFARRGLPAENSISWLLARLVGSGRAADLLLSSRIVLAEEAHAIGLVEHLSEPGRLLDDVMAYARDMALNCSPHGMAAVKQQIAADWERSAEASRQAALRLVPELQDEDDFAEGVRSFTERRLPEYKGLSIDLAAPPHAP